MSIQVSTYLLFNGQCEEAFRFYEKTLGGKIVAMLPYEGSPAADQVPAESRKQILHALMTIDGQSLMASDAPAGRYSAPQGFSVSLQMKDVREAERIFNALAEGGKVGMPFQETFWAARFGMVVDRFGIPWMVNCEKAA